MGKFFFVAIFVRYTVELVEWIVFSDFAFIGFAVAEFFVIIVPKACVLAVWERVFFLFGDGWSATDIFWPSNCVHPNCGSS